MSYRKSHIKNRIYKTRPRKSIFKKLWFWILLLFLIIILSALYFLLFYPGLQIKNIVISGNEKVSTQDLQNIISNYSNTGLVKFWNFQIISRSIFLVNTDNLDKEILKQFPIIEKIKIDKNFPQTLMLGVTERKPIGIYCTNGGQCFLIDQNGIIFEKLSTNPENLTIVRQVTENGEVFTGENVVSQNVMDAVYKIQKSLKDNFQIDLKEALVASPVRLNVKTNENWQIYFDLSEGFDINFQITKLNLLLNKQNTPADRKNLRYINLIPKDRAIVCDNSICGGQ